MARVVLPLAKCLEVEIEPADRLAGFGVKNAVLRITEHGRFLSQAGVTGADRRDILSASNNADKAGLTSEQALPALARTGCVANIPAILHRRIPLERHPRGRGSAASTGRSVPGIS